jgi:hypothetical protein
LLGARVLNIGGTSAVVARRRASTLLAAENEWAVLSATPYLLRRQDVLRYLDLTQGDRVRVRVQRADGARETVTLPFVSDQAAPANIYVGGAAPIWAQQPNDGFWWRMLAPGVLYVNFRSYEKLRTRTADVMGLIDRDRPDKVILDMRDNSGGDFTVFRESMLKQIIARPWLNQDDRLFVLIGREMFSAAMTNAADLKIRTNATLVGEPIGERPNSYQEVRFFALPNSHLRAGVSTKYYEALPGQGNPDAVRPDVSRPPTWRRFSRNQDDALEWVLHQD